MRGNVKVYQKKIVDQRRKRLFFLSLFALLFLGLAFSGLSYLSQMDAFAIEQVKVEGTSRLDPSAIVDLANARMDGNYAHFFSKRNAFLYPRKAILADIAALPLVKSANIESDGWHAIVVRATERAEAALWCAGTKDAAGDCFSVDENGFIFAPATSTDDVIYRGKTAGDQQIGSQVMPAGDFKNLQFFVRELAALGVEPREVLIQDAGYMQISLRQGGSLVINASDDLSTVLSNLSTLVSDTSIVPDLDAFLSRLDYIRLDSGNKIFYKMKTAGASSSATTSTTTKR